MQTFRNLLKTEEAALNAEDIDVIFCGIPELHEAHDLLVSELQPLVDNWSDDQEVAEPIKVLVSALATSDTKGNPLFMAVFVIFLMGISQRHSIYTMLK